MAFSSGLQFVQHLPVALCTWFSLLKHSVCGSPGSCLDRSVRAAGWDSLVCCLRLVLPKLPSAPGTLTYNLAPCFPSKKSVYFTLLDFKLVLKCSPVTTPGMDTTSNSYHCQWRWPPRGAAVCDQAQPQAGAT